MIDKIKRSFMRVSWSGFFSFILAVLGFGVMVVFANFQWAMVLIGLAVYFVLVSFRDE